MAASPANRPAKSPERSRQVLTERTYIHETCGHATTLGGPEFVATANPINEIHLTYCSHCGENDSLTSFSWMDSGENIAEYVRRHQKEIPQELLDRCGHSAVVRRLVIGGLSGLLLGAAIGAGLGIGLSSPLWGSIVGVLLALVLGAAGAMWLEASHDRRVVQPALKTYLGVNSVGELR